MKRNVKLYCYFILGISFLSIVSCQSKKNEKPARSGSSSLIVDGIVVTPIKLEDKVIANANLLSYEEVELKAPVSGTVLSIDFQEGQTVKKGQPLIHIDDRNWKAQIKGATAQRVNASNELERKKELLKVGGASQEDVDNAKAALDALEAQIEQLSVSVTLANVVAPFDGKVGMRNFSLGSFLSQGQIITVVAQSQKLKVDFSLSSRYIEKVQIGNIVSVVSSSDTVMAVIYAINPTVSSTSRTIQIRAVIENNLKNFIPGDFTEVIVPISIDDKALVVPANCIVPDLSSQTLYIYERGRAIRKVIIPGIRTERIVQILEGIAPGDTIITTGLVQIKDKMPVQIGKIIASSSL
jgi:membrane fusion protein, multidrug efflux system